MALPAPISTSPKRLFLGLEAMCYQTGDVQIEEEAATVPVGYNGDLDGLTLSFACAFKF
jgi:hypothetical protein